MNLNAIDLSSHTYQISLQIEVAKVKEKLALLNPVRIKVSWNRNFRCGNVKIHLEPAKHE